MAFVQYSKHKCDFSAFQRWLAQQGIRQSQINDWLGIRNEEEE